MCPGTLSRIQGGRQPVASAVAGTFATKSRNTSPTSHDTDKRFRELVKLYEGGGDPPEVPPTDRGGHGWGIPEWSKYVVAFLLGYLLWFMPATVAGGAILTSLGFTLFAGFRRWR